MRIELGIELGKSLPVGATRERIGGRLNRPALEAAQALERVLRPADGFPELAVADHVDAGRGLPADHLGNRLGKAATIIRLLERLARLLGAQELLQSLRPDQAADMGREDALGASLHVPCYRAAGARAILDQDRLRRNRNKRELNEL